MSENSFFGAPKQEGFQVAISSLTLGTLHEAILAFSMQESMEDFWQAICQNVRWLIPSQRMCVLLARGENDFEIVGQFAKGRFQQPQGLHYTPGDEALRAALNKVTVQWFKKPQDQLKDGQSELLSWLFADNPEMLFVLPIRTKGGILGAIIFVMQTITAADQAMLNTLGTIFALHAGQTYSLIRVTEERREMQDRLLMQEKMASLGNLVAGVAHEVNNPIGAVNSAADTIARICERIETMLAQSTSLEELRANPRFSKTLGLLRDNNRVIATAGQRIGNIVQSLKNFARLDEAEFKKVNIHEGLDSTLTLVDHELKGRVEIVKEYGALPLVSCYPNQLNQVFMNLFVNAAQAIEGPGTITIRTTVDSNRVHIAITDTGKGIDPADVERIFSPGFTTKGVGVGTGLGLSISYNIVEKHQGSIAVQSAAGQGATFTVILPLDPTSVSLS